LGHDVTVFSGLPYPRLDPGVGFVGVPGLDLYRDDTVFRRVSPRELRAR
jgi:hypothetical protein